MQNAEGPDASGNPQLAQSYNRVNRVDPVSKEMRQNQPQTARLQPISSKDEQKNRVSTTESHQTSRKFSLVDTFPALLACRSCKVIEGQGYRRCVHREWPIPDHTRAPGPQRHSSASCQSCQSCPINELEKTNPISPPAKLAKEFA